MIKIEELFAKLHLNPKYKGYAFLETALNIAMEEELSLVHLNTCIYKPVALQYHTSPTNVERNIRTLLQTWWATDFHNVLYQLTPHPVPARPTIGEFLDILRWILRNYEEQTEAPTETATAVPTDAAAQIVTSAQTGN